MVPERAHAQGRPDLGSTGPARGHPFTELTRLGELAQKDRPAAEPVTDELGTEPFVTLAVHREVVPTSSSSIPRRGLA